MINIKFNGKKFKIYSDGKIKCLEECDKKDKLLLRDIIDNYWLLYGGPEYGFPVSNMANNYFPQCGIEVLSYRDYEMENADPDTVY